MVFLRLAMLGIIPLIVGCGTNKAAITALNLSTNFTASNSISRSFSSLSFRPFSLFSACTSGATTDIPGTTAGLDCDGDGGAVAYQTPTSYKLAFKSVYLITPDGTKKYALTFDTLNDITSDGVKSFSPTATSVALDLGAIAGTEVSSFGFELYYFQVKIKLYGTEREIRIYMSDDDFPTEGSRGHHQGDITYFDDSGVEHWAKGGANWLSDASSTTTRGSFANGIAGADAETGHTRGMFGDADFWNASKLNQGSGVDRFYVEESLTGTGSTLTATFDISDTWFYEDFFTTTPNSFDPCSGSTLEGCGGEWAPLFPTVSTAN